MNTTTENATRPRYTAAKLLGFTVRNNLVLAKKVETGFDFSALEQLSERTGLSPESLRTAVRITPRTMSRRRKAKRLSPEESDRLVSVARLIAHAFELFGGRTEEAVRWFTAPNRALGGMSPIEAASTEVGSREVDNLIGRLEHGVYT